MDNQIISMNMTNFFNRELMMYALGDIKFKKPISMKTVAYTLGFLLVWSLPLVMSFGIPTGPIPLVIYFVPPVLLGRVASRPVFGGKTLVDFIKTTFMFMGEPPGWADMKPFDKKEQNYYLEQEVWISRRRELALLADMVEDKPVEFSYVDPEEEE